MGGWIDDRVAMVVILAIIGGVLYRLGGYGKPFASWYRDWLVPLLLFWALPFNWALIPCYALMGGALSAYWQLDEMKWGFFAHGLGLSLCMLPYALMTGHWLGFGIRCLALTALITIWSEFISNAFWEEFGRGFFIIISLPILLI